MTYKIIKSFPTAHRRFSPGRSIDSSDVPNFARLRELGFIAEDQPPVQEARRLCLPSNPEAESAAEPKDAEESTT